MNNIVYPIVFCTDIFGPYCPHLTEVEAIYDGFLWWDF